MVAVPNMAMKGMAMNGGMVAPGLSRGLVPAGNYFHPMAGASMAMGGASMGGVVTYAAPMYPHASWNNQAADAMTKSRMSKQPQVDADAMSRMQSQPHGNERSRSFMASYASP